MCNGQVLAQASQFSLRDVEVICATVSLESVRSKRASTASLMEQSSSTPGPEVIRCVHSALPGFFPALKFYLNNDSTRAFMDVMIFYEGLGN